MNLLPLSVFCISVTIVTALPTNQIHNNSFKTTGQGRIVGGSPAAVGQFPYSAAIYKYSVDGGLYFCGGALINNQWVLTSGGCVENTERFQIQIGSNYLQSQDSNKVILTTSTCYLNDDYVADTFENDIGLIKFRLPIEFNDYVKSIYLPTSRLPSSITVLAIGWGQVDDAFPDFSDDLRFVQVSPVTNAECQRTFYNFQITDNMVCVAGNNNEGTCFGDIGGPLVEHLSSSYSWVVGISSFLSSRGCESSDPSGYTRVFEYRDWINSLVQNSSQ